MFIAQRFSDSLEAFSTSPYECDRSSGGIEYARDPCTKTIAPTSNDDGLVLEREEVVDLEGQLVRSFQRLAT